MFSRDGEKNFATIDFRGLRTRNFDPDLLGARNNERNTFGAFTQAVVNNFRQNPLFTLTALLARL